MNKFGNFLVGLAAVSGLYSCSDGSVDIYMPARLNESDMWSIVNARNGEVVAQDAFSRAPSAIGQGNIFYVETSDGLFEYYKVSDVNNPISSERFSQAGDFNTDVAFAVKPDETISLINSSIVVVKQLPASVKSVYGFSGELARFKNEKGLYGYLNKKGEVAIEAKYAEATNFSGDYAFVFELGENSKILLIDKQGKTVTQFAPDRYDWIYFPFFNGYFAASTNGKVTLYNDRNEKVLSNNMMEYDGTGDGLYLVHEGKFIFSNDDMYGLMDMDGKVLVRPKYKSLRYFGNDRYVALRNDVYGVVDGAGEEIIPFEYEFIRGLGKNRYLVSEANFNCYIVDEDLKEILPMEVSDYVLSPGGRIDSEYVDVSAMVDKLASKITPAAAFGVDKSKTADQVAAMLGFTDPLQYRWNNEFRQEFKESDIDAVVVYSFAGTVASYDYDFSLGDYVDRFTSAPIEDVTVFLTKSSLEYRAVQRQLAPIFVKNGFRRVDDDYVAANGMTVSMDLQNGSLAIRCRF